MTLLNNTLYVSIVSHHSFEEIEKNFKSFPKKIMNYKVVICIIDNIGDSILKDFCVANDFIYNHDGVLRGYGGNHNKNFDNIDANQDDIFLVINPDVYVTPDNLKGIVSYFSNHKINLMGVKVYESHDFIKKSSHNRSFPALLDPIISMVFKKKLFENDINTISNPDWIGGAFMMFRPYSFETINGFDEYFFMYYEDIDICRRLNKNGGTIVYNPNYFIVHEAQRGGRKLFSKLFFMNMVSMIKYFFRYPTIRLITLK